MSASLNYAVRFLCYLARTGQPGPVRCGKAAAELGLSRQYLRSIVAALSRASLVSAKRGPRGGFTLTRPAADISLLAVTDAVHGKPTDTNTDQLGRCMRKAETAYRRSLATSSIADMLLAV